MLRLRLRFYHKCIEAYVGVDFQFYVEHSLKETKIYRMQMQTVFLNSIRK
jgi:hypothetical protein